MKRSNTLASLCLAALAVLASERLPGADQNVTQLQDETAIRVIVSPWDRTEPGFREVDWENAFGVRLKGFTAVDQFITTRVRPTQRTALMKVDEVRVSFIAPDIAVADRYWTLIGQTDGENGPKLPDRKGRTTYVLQKQNGMWTVLVERIADLRSRTGTASPPDP